MNPIMREIPYSFDTERLTIRGPLPGDGDKVRTAVLESQAELKPWMPWAVKLQTFEETLDFLARSERQFEAVEHVYELAIQHCHTAQ